MDKKQIIEQKKFALRIRIETLTMLAILGNGHAGGSLSIADCLSVLYNGQMKIDPQNPDWEERDYFVMSKGHCGPALYATLALKGYFPMEELKTLNQIGTSLPSHSDRTKTVGVDMSTGSLGQGVSAALGMALGLKIDKKDNYVFAIIGDGEAQEGQVWETMMIAPNKCAKNFIVIMDDNKQQLDGFCSDINDIGDAAKKAEAFGWFAVTCDGHDVVAINDAINQCKAADKPGFISLQTIKGKGWKKIEGDPGNHAVKGMSLENIADALADLNQQLAELS
ncbi:MAG: transketolase [Christensenellales bacterium]